MPLQIRIVSLLCITLLLGSDLPAETLTLSKDFVVKNENRATLDNLTFELDAHLKKPHTISSGGDDGDVHMAGRSDQVRLPMVAEIVNAGFENASVTLMNNTSQGGSLSMSGVWRIWFEHPSTGDQTQGAEVGVPETSNPDHVFEIHPITKFGTQDISVSSFEPILDPKKKCSYNAYPASKAFAVYERQQATISVSDSAVSITAKKVGYNYAEFFLEPVGKYKAGDGDNGLFVLANVYDESDEETPVTDAPRRMVFVAGTDPAKALDALQNQGGGKLHVLGIPRVNLAEVAAVSGDSVDMALPYEMIVVAVLGDDQTNFCATEQKRSSRSTADNQ